MEKFNKMLGVISAGGAVPQDTLLNPDGSAITDTDSNIGQSGELQAPEAPKDVVIIHMAGGVELHMPLEVAEMISKAINSDCGCDDETTPEE